MSNSFSKPEHFSILYTVTITLHTVFILSHVFYTYTQTARKFNLTFNATLIYRDFLTTGGETVRLA
jgi:hypothetical protein